MRSFLKNAWKGLLVLPVLLIGTTTVGAVPTITVNETSSVNCNKLACLSTLGNNIINIILYIAGFLAVIYLIYNGIRYILSAGDSTKATDARKGIINAVIGVVIIVASYAIVNLALGVGGSVSEAGSTELNPK